MNPKAVKQVSVRAAMRFLSQEWNGLGAPAWATWEELADATKISPFNAYVQHNLRLHRSMLPFTQEYPAADLSTVPSGPTVAGTGGVRCATLEITPGVDPALWGWIVFRGLAAPSGLFSEVVGVIAADGANSVTYVDTPLVANTYHYRCLGFNDDGKSGAVSADEDVIVTD
jgi:hypothetical protein